MHLSLIYFIDGERSTKSRKSGSRPTTWQRTALMIFGKIADHKAGPAFLKTIKDPHYSKIVKSPLFLDNVKTRIRNKVFIRAIMSLTLLRLLIQRPNFIET